MPKFDPYYEWLDIESHERPITPYLLLGLENYEDDQELIASAAQERIEYVEQFQESEYSEAAAKVLKQINEAYGCLSDPKKKAKYDQKLRAHHIESGIGTEPPPVAGVAQAVAPPRAQPVAQAAAPPVAGSIPRASAVPTASAASSSTTYTGRKKKSNPWVMIGGGAGVVAVLIGVLLFIFMENQRGERYVSDAEKQAAKKKEEASAQAAAETPEPSAPVSLDDPTLTGPSLEDPAEPTQANPTQGTQTEPGGTEIPMASPPVQPPVEPEPAGPTEPTEIAWAAAEDPAEKTPILLTADRLQPVEPSSKVASFAMSPLDAVFACASPTNTIQLWDLEKKAALPGIRVSEGRVLAVACPNPEQTLVWSSDLGVQTYSNADGSLLNTFSHIPATLQHSPKARPDLGMAISPGGKYFTMIRDDIRIYQVSDGKLCGIAPLTPGQEVLAQAFHPKGDRLYYVAQNTRAPIFYSIVRVNLKDGKSDDGKGRTRPGYLLQSPMPPTLEFLTDGDYSYLFLGNRYVLNHDDGAIALRLTGTAPDYWLPMGKGKVWTMTASGKQGEGSLDWETMVKAVRDQDRNSGIKQVGYGAEVNVDIRISATSSVSAGNAKERIQQAVENRLKAEGMRVGGNDAETRLEVVYQESRSGSVSTVDCVMEDGTVETKNFEGSVPGVLGEVTLTYHSQGLGKRLFFAGSSVPPEYVICPADKANGTLQEAYGAAVMEGAAGLITGMMLNYYYSEGLVGTKKLPIEQARLK